MFDSIKNYLVYVNVYLIIIAIILTKKIFLNNFEHGKNVIVTDLLGDFFCKFYRLIGFIYRRICEFHRKIVKCTEKICRTCRRKSVKRTEKICKMCRKNL